jgi:hypothetical protein
MTIQTIREKIEELDNKMSIVLEEDISKDYRIHVEGIRQGLSWALIEIEENSNE